MKFKKALSICLSTVMIISAANMTYAVGVKGDPYTIDGGYIYFDGETGSVHIYNGTATSIVIPSKINGIDVTTIGANGEKGFKGTDTDNLVKVTIPESITDITGGVFGYCDKLESIEVVENNKNYKSIDGVLFTADGKKLVEYPANKEGTSYKIPDGVTSIDDSAFLNCTKLTSIEIPDSVTDIGFSSFEGCSKLTTIKLPKSVKTIGFGAFNECSGLTSVEIPNSVTSIDSWAFCECSNLTDITIPDSVTTINEGAFDRCSSLTSIKIPSSVKTIGKDIFGNVDNYSINKTIKDKLTVICEKDSAIDKYCQENGYKTSYDGKTVEENKTETQNIYSKDTALNFKVESLNDVTDEAKGIALIEDVVKNMTDAEKTSVKAKDLLAYVAEEVGARSSVVSVDNDIVIDDSTVGKTIENVNAVNTKIENILSQNSLNIRKVRSKAKIATSKNAKVSITKDKLSGSLDVVEATTPYASFEFNPNSVVSLSVESTGIDTIKVDFTKTDDTYKVNLKFPNITSGDFKAIADENGNVLVTKYNPVTNELSAEISKSGEFKVIENKKTFKDINDKPQDVQNAVNKLASAGVINGIGEDEFSPDSPITRAEIAALVVRILNIEDSDADGGFTDVTNDDWYYAIAGAAKQENIIKCYEDNTFRGDTVIPKVQVTSVIARILTDRLGYVQGNGDVKEFADYENIPDWAVNEVSTALNANMIIKRTDNKFDSDMEMTRGDTAVIIEKLFDKVW